MNLHNTNYSQEMDPYSLGQILDSRYSHKETGIASGSINFGAAVMKNTTDGTKVSVLNSASGKFRGVALKSHTIASGVGYVDTDPVNILRQGAVPVQVSEAVVADDVAYATVATPGQFCKTATGNVATGGVFRSDAAAGGVALLEINLP